MSKNNAYYKALGRKTSVLVIIGLGLTVPAYASTPSSTNYKLPEYTFGSGGTNNSTSTNFRLKGVAGEVEFGRPSSTNYKLGSGLTYLNKSNVPPAPTLSNPSTNYDRLKLVINTNNHPTDTEFAVAISSDNFVSDVRYVKSDNTIGTTLSTTDFKTYTSWGTTTGVYITGLQRNTTYYVKAKARQGSFTESEWGPTSTGIPTSDASLTFTVDSSSIAFNNLNSSNSYTDTSKSTTVTTSTNAYNGYVVNARTTGLLTSGSTTIAAYTSPNSAPTSWSGLGFGYTTTDSDLTGGTNNRFTNGGAKYAGFTTSSPGDPVADHAGPILSTISNEQFTINYRVTVNSTQKAGRYNTTVLYVVVPSY